MLHGGEAQPRRPPGLTHDATDQVLRLARFNTSVKKASSAWSSARLLSDLFPYAGHLLRRATRAAGNTTPGARAELERGLETPKPGLPLVEHPWSRRGNCFAFWGKSKRGAGDDGLTRLGGPQSLPRKASSWLGGVLGGCPAISLPMGWSAKRLPSRTATFAPRSTYTSIRSRRYAHNPLPA
eukprot:COSAG06_NODE_403_length_16181_cov_10.431911_12_plen_182_part_00